MSTSHIFGLYQRKCGLISTNLDRTEHQVKMCCVAVWCWCCASTRGTHNRSPGHASHNYGLQVNAAASVNAPTGSPLTRLALLAFDPFSLHEFGVFSDAVHGAYVAAVAGAVVAARRPVPADVLRARSPQRANASAATDPACLLVAHQPCSVVDDLPAAALLEGLELGPWHVMNAVDRTRVYGFFDYFVIVALPRISKTKGKKTKKAH